MLVVGRLQDGPTTSSFEARAGRPAGSAIWPEGGGPVPWVVGLGFGRGGGLGSPWRPPRRGGPCGGLRRRAVAPRGASRRRSRDGELPRNRRTRKRSPEDR